MTEEEQAGPVPGGTLTGSMPETPIVPPAPPANIDLSPSPDPTTPPSSVPRPLGYILDQLHSRDVAEAMLINALIKAGWPRDRAPDRAVALMTRDATAKDRFTESDWKGFERTIDESLGNLRMSPRQWREIRMMFNGWRGQQRSGADSVQFQGPPSESHIRTIGNQTGGALTSTHRQAAGAMSEQLPSPGARRENPVGESEPNGKKKVSAAIIDTPAGPHLMLDPVTSEPYLVEAESVQRFSSKIDRRIFEHFTVRPNNEVSGDEPSSDQLGILLAGHGQVVVIRYPNGTLFKAQNRQTGETLHVGRKKMKVIPADQAESLGLGDWMPYRRVDVEDPSFDPPMIDSADLRKLKEIRKGTPAGRVFSAVEFLLEKFLPEATKYEAEDVRSRRTREIARELYAPRVEQNKTAPR